MAGYISDETIEKVLDAADIVNVISNYVPLKKMGGNYVGLCPFHNEKTPSFTVSDQKQIFHCFGCGEGGNALSFIMKKENLSFPEAVKNLGQKLGIEVEEDTKQDDKLAEIKNRAYDINRDTARFFYNNLINNKQALNYLYNRKINAKVIKQFGLGYAANSWDSLYKHLESKGYKAEEVEKLGLIGKKVESKDYYDKFRNRIIYPIIDTKGRVIGFGGRVLDNTMPKYLNSQETLVFNKGYNLYGLNLVSKLSDRKRIVLVEGYMDVISFFNKGINYAVASLGTALTEKQAKLIKRYGEEVYICYDSDQAGINATQKAVQILIKEDINPKIITLGKYKDPDDFFKENNIEKFEYRLNQALNHIEYRIEIIKKRHNLDDAEGKIKFSLELSKIIKELKSPIEKEIYIDKLSKELNLPKEAIYQEVFGNNIKKFKDNMSKDKINISPVKATLPSASITAEINLINFMIYDKDYFEMITNEIYLEDYSNVEFKQVIKIITNLYKENEVIDRDKLYNTVKNIDGLDKYILQSIFEKSVTFTADNVDQMVNDLIKTLKVSKLEARRDFINKEIATLEKNKNKTAIEEENFLKFCVELTNLNKELNLMRHEEGR